MNTADVGVLCAFSFHPMRFGKTLINSFLVNCGMLCLCALPVAQFCAQVKKNESHRHFFGYN